MENEELKELNQAVKKEKKPKYKIRKLTPHECHRLMGVSEKDFDAAEKVVSNSQLYKIAGNAIVVPVLCAIFSQLGISGTKRWNDMTLEEKKKAIYKGHFLESKCI